MNKQLISFRLLDEEYGIDILYVEGIHRLKEITITKVAQAPEYIEGIVNLRGEIIPVIDLQKRFSLGESSLDKDTRIIVINIKEKACGLLVDEVNEVIDVEKNSIDDPPQEIIQIDTNLISGIAKKDERLIIILDIDNILSTDEEEELAGIAGMEE